MAQPAHLARIGVRLEAVPSPGWAFLGLVVVNLMWGGSLPATKLALDSFGPFTLAAARLLLATALFSQCCAREHSCVCPGEMH